MATDKGLYRDQIVPFFGLLVDRSIDTPHHVNQPRYVPTIIPQHDSVFSRYLLHYGGKDVSINAFTLLCLTNLGAFIIYTPRMIFKYGRRSTFQKAKSNINQAGGFFKLVYKHRYFIGMMCLYQLSIVSGSSLRELATYYSTATYVQLTLLSSPFIIYFLGILVFGTEKFSWLDVLSCLFTVTGAVIVILASSTRPSEDLDGKPVEFHWKWWPDFSHLGRGFNWPNDFIGIVVALISSVFFSMKMNTVNKLSTSTSREESKDGQLTTADDGTSHNKIMLAESQSSAVLDFNDYKNMDDSTPTSSNLTQRHVTLPQNEESQEVDETNSYRSSMDDLNGPLLATDNTELESQVKEESPPDVDPEDLFYIQKVFLITWPIIPMAILQDWSVFGRFTWQKWCIFVWFMVMNRLVAAIGELVAAKEIGGGAYGTMFPLRIVIGLVLSSLILGEWIDNIVSVIGCLIVVIAITVFSIKKHTHSNK